MQELHVNMSLALDPTNGLALDLRAMLQEFIHKDYAGALEDLRTLKKHQVYKKPGLDEVSSPQPGSVLLFALLSTKKSKCVILVMLHPLTTMHLVKHRYIYAHCACLCTFLACASIICILIDFALDGMPSCFVAVTHLVSADHSKSRGLKGRLHKCAQGDSTEAPQAPTG